MPVPTPQLRGRERAFSFIGRKASGPSAAHAFDAQHERGRTRKATAESYLSALLLSSTTFAQYYFCALAIASISTCA